jgi:predicted Zn-dependent protease
MKTTMRLIAPLLAAALLAACGTVVQNPVTGRAERSVMDEAAEIAEGRKAHAEVVKEYGAYADPKLQAYVSEIGQRLAKASHRPQLPWTFTVLDSPEVNAFALPGGYVYITRGIMAYLDSEADLAGVLGHEIGHVTARHGAQRATRQQSAGLGVLAATVLGVALEGVGVRGAADAVGSVSQSVAAGYVASYSSEQELQADQLGAEYLARVAYDPKNMVDVIRVLKDQEAFAAQQARAEGREVREGGGASWLASHPTSDQRLQQIMATAQKKAAERAGRTADDGRARYLQAIDGMSFGEGREQGVTRGRRFFHEPLDLAITAPEGWKIRNGAQVLMVVNRTEDAALLMRPLPPAAGTDHPKILRDLVKAEGGRSERLTLGGALAATHYAGARRNANGQLVPVELTIVSGPGERVYVLQYAATNAQALARSRGALREAELTFRRLSAADREAARPWAVKVVPLPAGDAYAQLARSSPLTELPEAHLRLLNASAPDLRPGQPAKSVR